ncbi:MAG: DNA-directed RNA polymerase subunit L [Candidatus Hadarchaeales archaeon]
MELEVVKRGERELLVRVPGEDATLCNLLVKNLHSLPEVEFAAYRKEHPLLTPYEIAVRVRGRKPEEALLKAAQKVVDTCRELLGDLKGSGK